MFDPKHPHGHVTRSGKPARIICTDNDNPAYPIVAVVGGQPSLFTSDGHYWASVPQDGMDLLNVPEPVLHDFHVTIREQFNTVFRVRAFNTNHAIEVAMARAAARPGYQPLEVVDVS